MGKKVFHTTLFSFPNLDKDSLHQVIARRFTEETFQNLHCRIFTTFFASLDKNLLRFTPTRPCSEWIIITWAYFFIINFLNPAKRIGFKYLMEFRGIHEPDLWRTPPSFSFSLLSLSFCRSPFWFSSHTKTHLTPCLNAEQWLPLRVFFTNPSYGFINKVASSKNQDWLPHLHCILIKRCCCCSSWFGCRCGRLTWRGQS